MSEVLDEEIAEIAARIDHTVLGAEVGDDKVVQVCSEARLFGFRTAFVPPCWVERAVGLLRDTDIGVGSTVGFPFGNDSTAAKAAQAVDSVKTGASDVDMVINIGWVKDGRWGAVRADIEETVRAAREAGGRRRVVVKVIIETCLLTAQEKERTAHTIVEAGADFVKTSTGYAQSGAVVSDVALLRAAVGPGFGIKASGGIRTLDELREMVAAGADRIGTSAGVAIVEELKARMR